GNRCAPTTRSLYSESKDEIVIGGLRAGPGRVAVLSPDGALAMFSALLARPLAADCPMMTALLAASERLVTEAHEAASAKGRPLELAKVLCQLTADSLATLDTAQTLDPRLDAGLARL